MVNTWEFIFNSESRMQNKSKSNNSVLKSLASTQWIWHHFCFSVFQNQKQPVEFSRSNIYIKLGQYSDKS